MWQTRVTEQYGLEWPLIGAGLSFMATAPLAAAISNCGGLGMLGASPLPPEMMRALIRATAALTKKPFGVHLHLPYTECGHIDVCLETGVSVVSFQGETPPEAFITRLRAGGISVWMQVGTLTAACAAVEARADAVVLHRPDADILSLLPEVVDAIAPVPVIAGDMMDGRRIAAALSLGAEAVCIGKRLASSREAATRIRGNSHRLICTPTAKSELPAAEVILTEMRQDTERVIHDRLLSFEYHIT